MKRERKSGRNQSQLLRAIESLESRLLLSATRYVDLNSPGPAHDGTSWGSAYIDLQQALTAAASGDEIHVANGTYKPTSGTSRSISFALKTGVSVLGGYAGSGALDPNSRDIAANVTMLSGDIGMVGSNADNSYHVVVGSDTDSTAILGGFTITAGNANGDISPTHLGGGTYNSHGSPTLTNCTFSGNSADYGAGMFNVRSSPALTNCTFTGNSATNDAGGMYNVSSSSALTNCIFSGNSASGDGGGMYNDSSSPTLDDCTFSGNSAGYAGGMYNIISSPALSDCTFGGNSATWRGGGMYNYYYSSPALTNCTFSGNSASSSGGGMYNAYSSPKVTNCIIWGSGSSPIYNNAASEPVLTYSDIQGGDAGTGNIHAEPLFVRNPSPGPDTVWGTADDDYGDLRLRLGSPCIDAGSNAAVPTGTTTDLAGNPRFIDVPGVRDPGAIVDMGAYEYTLPLAASAGAFLVNAARPTVKVSFNGDLNPSSLSASDLTLVNLTTGQPIDCGASATVSYDASTRSANWALSILLSDGNYRVTLPAASVSDANGNLLAGDFSFEFFSLAGDANHDRAVDITDLGILATNWQGSDKTFTQGDFSYDGIVDISDLGMLATSWQKSLAAPTVPVKAPALRITAPVRAAASVPATRRTTRLASDILDSPAVGMV